MQCDFDVIVLGGGHAGCEAAFAAARLGCRTALVTLSTDTIAQMSCNPAVGGVGKGQIVREIDALGGLMGLAADATGIQFRMLNRSKGPAVHGPRCQVDRHAYAAWVQRLLARQSKLTIIEGEATDIVVEGNRVAGVRVRETPEAHRLQSAGLRSDAPEAASLDDEISRSQRREDHGTTLDLTCRAVIVTAGTFLRGRMHCGERTWSGGRYGEPAAEGLSASLESLGISLDRLKTGTCPRLAADTIDCEQCQRQDGDDPPKPFSFLTDRLDVEQVACWLTHTTEAVHEIVRANLARAPLYIGQIRSTGPRYCPSFETKVVRFADKASHLVFLEPEGRRTRWVYANGISTSLPMDVQAEMVRRIPGLQRAEVVRWGYAIEYDYAPPQQLTPALQTKAVAGLFLAGQINGTTGYEEAAALGLMAGANAALGVLGGEPLILGRDQAYIGVMIDDLVTKGVVEPYRMFTSRAEHRLRLRADNADRRLTDLGRRVGLVSDERWRQYQDKAAAGERARSLLQGRRVGGRTLWELLGRPDVTLDSLVARADTETACELRRLDAEAVASVAVDARYSGYVAKQASALRQMQDLDRRTIPDGLNYDLVAHLRHEARQHLSRVRPRSLGQALRVPGITPADITVLAVHLARRGAAKAT